MQRIASICPSNTEILWSLGLGNQIVGVDNYSDWPPALDHLPRLGPDLKIDMDKLKALQPDWVLASLSVPGMEKNIEALEKTGIPFIVLEAGRLEDIPSDFIKVAQFAGIEQRGRQMADQFKEKLESIHKNVPHHSAAPRLYWEWWPKPVFTPGRENWLTDLSQIVGGKNIFGDEKGQTVKTDWKSVADRHPDLTLIVWTGVPKEKIRKEKITGRPPWQGLPFAEEHRVHILEEGWYCRPSPRILTGVEHLAHVLYPDRFQPPNPEQPI
ncbi:ABC transporter substrate-binding protein [Melghirimyces algeriensis]|uniref:Iron complex transport system substrate-binding protein n=1 Tax=Melghirimyces algeriensis TaxID=910412 RepID=A0A521EFA7_9BACL|nr:cobalamin-binding protein [Melghirimyces algeriensis]SMO82607.1 iron complex transport system substrate-binding protein [Melghirimyces algeriensis]